MLSYLNIRFYNRRGEEVLILVLMEYALLPQKRPVRRLVKKRLNPCSNGICSLTCHNFDNYIIEDNVLILVLMEYALLQSEVIRILRKQVVLILVLMEYALLRQRSRRHYRC